MVPQGIRPVVQLTAIEVPHCSFFACCCLLNQKRKKEKKRFPLSLKVFCGLWGIYFLPGLDVGLKEHEVLPISHSFLAKFDRGMRW